MKCPECGNDECERDEVDVGVGVIHGPWGCPSCGWSEDSYYDRSNGKPSEAQKDHPEFYVDQFGGMQRISKLAENAARFGIKEDTIKEVFGND